MEPACPSPEPQASASANAMVRVSSLDLRFQDRPAAHDESQLGNVSARLLRLGR